MIARIIELKKDEIAALCRKYRVRTLWVFGSATTDAFDPEVSDFDFLVDLGEYDDDVHHRFLDLADSLEELLLRRIDLVTVRGVTQKPRFEAHIEATKVKLYDGTTRRKVA